MPQPIKRISIYWPEKFGNERVQINEEDFDDTKHQKNLTDIESDDYSDETPKATKAAKSRKSAK